MDPINNGESTSKESGESGNMLMNSEDEKSHQPTLQTTTTTASSPLMHSQSLPVGFSSPTTNHWQHNTYPHQYEHHGEQEEQRMDGFQATTLVGVGGLIGWTAAAAYRWLNGGDFSVFPPPPTYNNNSRTMTAQQAAATHQTPLAAERGNVSFSNHSMTTLPHENVSSPTHWNSLKEYPSPPNQSRQQQQPQGTSQTDKLAEQVQSLVEALQKQSTEHREIVKRLSQQFEKQQTNESMQRLRAENTSSSSSSSATMAIFCKLAEIQAELSSLRRDIRTCLPAESEKWDERLSGTLDQVQSCLAKLQTDSQSSSSRAATVVDTTPVRPKMNWGDETTNGEEAQKTTGSTSTDEPDTHAVASALRQLVLENEATPLRVGAQLLYLYAVNLVTHPTIPRYRKIFTANESFQRVDTLKGGRELLRAVGFKDGDKALEWEPGPDKEEHYLSLMNEVSTALGILKSPGQTTSSGELLERVLDCLSFLSAVTTTPAPTKSSEPDADTASSALPVVYKTPDPSILSPPVTKKQGMHSNPTVGFSPSILDAPSTADDSFFASDKNASKEAPIESLVDADNVWK